MNLDFSEKEFDILLQSTYGRYGYVYDIHSSSIILELDRKTYHTEQTKFPIAFFVKNNDTLLIHCTDWNNLDVTNLSTQEILTERINERETKYYLDYFYGELTMSPDNSLIASSGWVWHPASYIKIINLNTWLTKNIHEPEEQNNTGYCIMSYYRDRALCWLDNESILLLE